MAPSAHRRREARRRAGIPAMVETLGVVFAIGVVILVAARLVRSAGDEGPAGAAPPAGSVVWGASDAESWARAHIVEIAEELFVENPGLQWIIHGVRHADGMLFVEVEPVPDEVGVPRYQFVLFYGGGEPPRHLATYVVDGGEFVLMSTARGAPKDLPRRVDPV